jgi:hypothetical protein
MGGVCGTYGGDEKFINILAGKPEWRDIEVGLRINVKRMRIEYAEWSV